MDVKTAFNGELMVSDWQLAGPDLETDEGLATAFVISLFTDGQLHPDDPIPEGETGRGGFWGDVVAPVNAPEGEPWRTGSRLRLIRREKQTAETARRAEDICEEALAWAVKMGVVREVVVSAAWADVGRLELLITGFRPDGTPFKFRHLWSTGK